MKSTTKTPTTCAREVLMRVCKSATILPLRRFFNHMSNNISSPEDDDDDDDEMMMNNTTHTTRIWSITSDKTTTFLPPKQDPGGHGDGQRRATFGRGESDNKGND
ncbi:hypothetical protein GPALN_007860 [Globodera pallida]|nr:hypothetical protein GPALN_007860 [Globodera pallida]